MAKKTKGSSTFGKGGLHKDNPPKTRSFSTFGKGKLHKDNPPKTRSVSTFGEGKIHKDNPPKTRSFLTFGKGKLYKDNPHKTDKLNTQEDDPPKTNKLKPQKGCICLDILVDKEIERHAENIALQKELIERIEASEHRLAYGDWDEDDDDDDDEDEGRSSKEGHRRKRKAASASVVSSILSKVKLPTVSSFIGTVCYKKIRKEERKRRRFVSRLEREQQKYERQYIKAQKKYEKRRLKACKKCEELLKIVDKHKSVKIKQGDEVYSVYLNIDQRDCGCNAHQVFFAQVKRFVHKFCVCSFILVCVISASVYYIVNFNKQVTQVGL